MNRSSMRRTSGLASTNAVIGCLMPAATSSPWARNASTPSSPRSHAGVLEGAGEEQVVGGPLLHADPHSCTVDVGGGGERRLPRHGVHALDQDVRSREGDLGLTSGLDGEEADVCSTCGHRLEGLARRVEADELHVHPESTADLVGDVDGHAGRGGRRAVRQHRVAEVDGGTQGAGGGEVAGDGRERDRHAGRLGRGVCCSRTAEAGGPGPAQYQLWPCLKLQAPHGVP